MIKLKSNRALTLVLTVILLLGLIAGFTACLSACSENIQNSADTVSDSTGISQDEDNPQLDISVGDILGNSAELPENYPADIFPLYPDSYIVSAVGFEGMYTISAFTKDDYRDVAEFYKDVLKDAAVTYEAVADNEFTSLGTIESFSYSFDTGKSSEIVGYATSISIKLSPAK